MASFWLPAPESFVHYEEGGSKANEAPELRFGHFLGSAGVFQEGPDSEKLVLAFYGLLRAGDRCKVHSRSRVERGVQPKGARAFL
jgi:hypothetical protein